MRCQACCVMTSRALTVLLAALGTACASTTGFNEIPLPGRVVLLVAACVFVGALQMTHGVDDVKKILS